MQDMMQLREMGERIDNGNAKDGDYAAIFIGGRWYGFPEAGKKVAVCDHRMNDGRIFVVMGDEIKKREIVIGEDPETKQPITRATQFPVDADGRLTTPNLLDVKPEGQSSGGKKSAKKSGKKPEANADQSEQSEQAETNSESDAKPEGENEVPDQVPDGGDQGEGEDHAEGAEGGEAETPEGTGGTAS